MRKEENVAVRAVRSGFTLVELLVVVAILGILGAIGVQQVTSHIASAHKTAAKEGVNSIKAAMVQYMTKKHKAKAPTDLEVLIKEDDDAALLDGGEGALYDPWDNKYVLEHKKGSDFAIISFGPDGEKGTEDDIRSDEIKRKNN